MAWFVVEFDKDYKKLPVLSAMMESVSKSKRMNINCIYLLDEPNNTPNWR